jgi:AmmeMemoRadiSam system protein A
MSPLPEAERRTLLQLARRAIEEITERNRVLQAPPAEGQLAERCGVFVSLHHRGRLRGCIGMVEKPPPLAEGVLQCAISAARSDPRFEPVEKEELTALEIEISILSPLAPIRLEDVQVGVHGLYVVSGRSRGLLLPQVPGQFGWTPERFLEETCAKAGLPRDAWKRPETRVLGFTAEVFSEKDYANN